jgi:hypothetical protein
MTQAAQAFEFDAQQDQTIGTLAGRMKALGLVYIVMGVCVGLMAVFALLTQFFAGLIVGAETAVVLFIGIWTFQATKSFRQIVDTKGNDMMHLMNALESLRKLYNLQFWLLIAGLVIFVLAIVIVMAVGVGAFLSTEAASAT